MITALVCLWIGFAIGFVCAAILGEGRARADEGPEDEFPVPVVRSRR